MKKRKFYKVVMSNQGDHAQKTALVAVEAISCKGVCSPLQRNWKILLRYVPKAGNWYFPLCDEFDVLDKATYEASIKIGDDIAQVAKGFAKRTRGIKRKKKALTRIKKEVLHVCHIGGANWDEIKTDSLIFIQAVREMFAVRRKAIKPDVFQTIPDNERVTVNGKKTLLNSIYVRTLKTDAKGKTLDLYEINDTYGFEDSERIQYTLAKYSFPVIHKRWF